MLLHVLVGAVCLWGAPAVAAPPSAAVEKDRPYEPKLKFEVPPDVVLGERSSVELIITSPGKSAPTFTSSVGKVSSPRRIGQGKYAVTLELPTTKFPQYAIVAAIDPDRNDYGWLALPLLARAHIEVESEPHVNVSVRLRKTDFGPVLTDKRGKAQVEVLVPPGVSHALSIATDVLGNTSQKEIALGVPPSSRLLVYCPTDAEHVLVFLARKDGVGETIARFGLASERMVVGRPIPLEAGAFYVPFDVPEGIEAGVTALFEATAEESVSQCKLKIPLEEPTAVDMTADKEVVVADEETRVTLRVSWTFPGLRATRQMSPDLVPSLGTVQVQNVSNREQVIFWQLPKFFEKKSEATLQLSYEGEESLRTSHAVALRPGRLASLELSGLEEPLLANGKSSAVVTIVGRDRHGNLARLTAPKAELTGHLTEPELASDGSYRATYRTFESYDAESDPLTLRDESGVKSTISIPLRPRQRRFWGAARLGYLYNLAWLHTPVAAVGAGMRLPFGDENVVLELEAGVFFTGSRIQVGEEGTAEIDLSGVPVLARVGYQFSVSQLLTGLSVYPALSAGVLWVDAAAKGPAIDQSIHAAVPLFGGLVAADVPFGPGRPSVELGYFHGFLDEHWLYGSGPGLRIALGYTFTP